MIHIWSTLAANHPAELWTGILAVVSGIVAAIARFFRRKRIVPPAPKKELISLIVPFRADYPERARNWAWLRSYYEHALPEAEIIVGSNTEVPFRKTAAVNDAFSRAKGDVIVVLDADCYISADVIRSCAAQIRVARSERRKLWFIPYRRFYRLTEAASEQLLASDTEDPVVFGDPPKPWEFTVPQGVSFGHWYGALIQIMPREAFVAAGGMDKRFQGWGGEDVSFMHAVDTLYGRHKTFNGPVYHIHHPTIKGAWAQTRQWVGQAQPEMNDWLSDRYIRAVGDRARMNELVFGDRA